MKTAARDVAAWLVLGSLVGGLCGSISALFLWCLAHATALSARQPNWVYALPVAGFFMGLLLERFGQPIRGGNDLVIDTIRDGGPRLPLRLAPMVLFGTVLTHAFGGSAGREGAAVQMGASASDWLSHRLGLGFDRRRQLLVAGVAGGFGSVFGTPWAGAVFGLEFTVLGRIEYRGLIPALVASLVGDYTTRAWGITHAHYPAVKALPLSPLLAVKWLVFACACAALATAFIELTHFAKRVAERVLPRPPWRLFVGGLLVVGLWRLVGSSDYLGLGLPMIARAFEATDFPPLAFVLKLLFTVVTLGAGFLGGEVTPLFFMGAALGNDAARVLGIPIELGAGVGLAAVFAAASNTPLALSVMAVELLGGGALPHVALVCAAAYLLTGKRSIYRAQRLEIGKWSPRRRRAEPKRDE